MAIQESGEMYLETIYVLSQKSSSVRAIDVGESMGFLLLYSTSIISASALRIESS